MRASDRRSAKREKTGDAVRRPGSRSPWLVFGAAALVALLLYLPTLRYGFVWDDRALIVHNPFLAQAKPLDLFTRGFGNNPGMERREDDMSYYRPLANLSLYVDRKVWGLRPSGYHLTNVIINAAVVLLTCLLLWELFGSVWLAGLGGLLVGIHPAMNCAVTFISNRTYLLTLFFLLVSCYALFRGLPAQQQAGRRSRGRVWLVLFSVSLLLSALALESALVLAAIAAAWVALNRTRFRRLWAWVAAIVSPVAIYFLLRLGIAKIPFTASFEHQAITEPLRIIDAFGQQLQLLLFPFNQNVIYVPAKPLTSFSVHTILGLLFLGLPLYALIRLGRHRAGSAGSGLKPKQSARPELGRLGWYGYAWLVLFLLPFAHLVVLGPAGRMLYLAAPGVIILLVVLYQATNHEWLAPRVAYGAFVLYTALFAVQTLRRNPIWQSELSLSQTMVRETPGSAAGHLNYGAALAEAGRREEAIEQYRAALAIKPDYLEPHIGLAFALADRGDLSGAVRERREVVRLQPESPQARNDLAVSLRRNGQLDSAIVEYNEALRLNPNMALTLGNLGGAYLERGDVQQAIVSLKAALQLQPGLSLARASLAKAYQAAGMPDSAALVESGRL